MRTRGPSSSPPQQAPCVNTWNEMICWARGTRIGASVSPSGMPLDQGAVDSSMKNTAPRRRTVFSTSDSGSRSVPGARRRRTVQQGSRTIGHGACAPGQVTTLLPLQTTEDVMETTLQHELVRVERPAAGDLEQVRCRMEELGRSGAGLAGAGRTRARGRSQAWADLAGAGRRGRVPVSRACPPPRARRRAR